MDDELTKENTITIEGFVWDTQGAPDPDSSDAKDYSCWRGGNVIVKISDLEMISFKKEKQLTKEEEAEAFERRETADRKEANELAKEGTQVEAREILLFRRDYHDYEVGDEMWQEVMTHNVVVNLLKREPLSKAEMSFLAQQNKHLIITEKCPDPDKR